jgi:outer membrane protein assembly factor BamB
MGDLRLAVKAVSIGMALAAAAPPRASAGDWPCWRGPARNGISAETGWLDRWPAEGPRVLWKASVGTGFSSFAVAGGRAYTLGNADTTDTVFCLDAETGKVLWSHAYPSDLGDRYFEGGPTSTPAVDGGRVYTVGRWGDAFCFDAATGKVVWSKNIVQETGLPAPGWGLAGSPVVHGDLLLLNAGEAGLALEKATGRVVWKSAAKEPGYSTPLPVRRGDAELVLLGSGKAYLAVDPRTGREAWRVKWVTQYGCNAADPVVDGDRVFLSTGYGKGAALLQLGAGEPGTVWQTKVMRTQMNPCVLLGGFLYGVDGDAGQNAALKCVELATGAAKWAQEGFGNGAVLAADGKLIALSGKGELMVAPAAPEGFQPTARAQVLGGKCWTVPVLADGRIYCRNAAGDVVCLDVKKP